jgi:uncharacterized protein (TIGR01777 family)
MQVLISGGTGLIGNRLTQNLLQDGHTVSVLSRQPKKSDHPNLTYLEWDGKTVPKSAGTFEVVVNLAGAGIADRRWTKEYKRTLLESRLQPTKAIVRFIQDAQIKPRLFIQASAVGIYQTNTKTPVDETAEPGKDFLADLAVKWERAAMGAGVRTVWLRTGIVLAKEAGAFPLLLKPFRLYAGNYIGNGRQPFPWIHIADVIGIIRMIMEDDSIEGPINLVSPKQDTNRGFGEILGKAIGVPVVMGMPSSMVKLLMGERAVVLLEGQNVAPTKALAHGYQFQYPDTESAINQVLDDRGTYF